MQKAADEQVRTYPVLYKILNSLYLCNLVMPETSANQVKQWILEHACKHQMKGVIHAMKDDKDFVFKCLASKTEGTPSANHTYMCFLLLKAFLTSLEPITAYCNERDLLNFSKSCDLELVSLIIELLEEVFRQKNIVSLKLFISLSTRLKMLELLTLINHGKECSSVIEKVKKYFPRENEKFKKSIMGLNIEDPLNVERVQRNNAMCRRLVLRLLANTTYRKKYMVNCFEQDMKEFLLFIIEHITAILKDIECHLPPSAIENILAGADEDLVYSGDPAIHLLLEYLHPDVTEADLLAVLHALDPDSCSQIGALPIIKCLDSLNGKELPNQHMSYNWKNFVYNGPGNSEDAELANSSIITNVMNKDNKDTCSDTTELILITSASDSSCAGNSEIVEGTEGEESSFNSRKNYLLSNIGEHFIANQIIPCVVYLKRSKRIHVSGRYYEIFS